MDEKQLESLIESENLSLEEVQYLKSILMEVSATGTSKTLDAIWAQDYEEIPVSIDEFLTNDRYLGKSVKDDNGELTLYPFWQKATKEIFEPGNQYIEVALSGAIGIGKTTVAVVSLCYILYQLLCLKNPANYYGLTRGSKIAIAFFNINMDQAYGVGYARMQAYMKQSPWFLEHGTLVGRNNPTYYPDKNIELLVGSKADHFIGRDVFCLEGNTQVLTEDGPTKIKYLLDSPKRVFNSNGDLSDNPVFSIISTNTDELYEIELEDSTIIKCTPNHRFMLTDGTFKEAQELTTNDELAEVSC